MDVMKRGTIARFAIAGILLAPAAVAQDQKPDAKKADVKNAQVANKTAATKTNVSKTDQAPASAAKNTNPPVAGMVVVKDPVTGQLRAPTAQEAADLQLVQSQQTTGVVSTGPTPIMGAGGAPGMRLDESTTVYSIATKNSDGTVSLGEATGPENADKAVQSPNAAKKPAQEVSNDR
jgi:hypothetical protein